MSEKNIIVGVDEAGRGPLAGPVIAAAVILSDKDNNEYVDSKQCSDATRQMMAANIINHSIAWSIGVVTPNIIDQINILQATMLAMKKAVDAITIPFDLILVDGNRTPEWPYQSRPEVKGDQRFRSIAAASIIAKVTRDNIMKELHEKLPVYGWNRNVGYPTAEHLDALKKHGISQYHRQSYAPVRTVVTK